jgi:hypothetical protein
MHEGSRIARYKSSLVTRGGWSEIHFRWGSETPLTRFCYRRTIASSKSGMGRLTHH